MLVALNNGMVADRMKAGGLIVPNEISTTDSSDQQRPLVVSMREAANLLGVSLRTISSLTADGDLPHARIGRRVVYPVAALERWLASRSRDGRTR